MISNRVNVVFGFLPEYLRSPFSLMDCFVRGTCMRRKFESYFCNGFSFSFHVHGMRCDEKNLLMSVRISLPTLQRDYSVLWRKKKSCGKTRITTFDSALCFVFFKSMQYFRFNRCWQIVGKLVCHGGRQRKRRKKNCLKDDRKVFCRNYGNNFGW